MVADARQDGGETAIIAFADLAALLPAARTLFPIGQGMARVLGCAPAVTGGSDFLRVVAVEQIEHPVEIAVSFRVRTIHKK